MMYSLTKMHITPDDYLAKYEEYDDADFSYVKYFIEPYGSHEINEMSDTHYKEGDEVPYHEHERGYETFLIDGGSVEVTIRGKRTIAHKGDMVHIPPFIPHKFRFLEHNTIWRELFQEIQMNSGMMEHLRVKQFHRDRITDPEYTKENHKRHKSIWYEVQPEPDDVTKYDIPEIRPFDFALAEFSFDHVVLRQKVKRAETAGVKEVWQAVLDSGVRLSWNEENPFPKLFVVYSGQVKVKVDGEKDFVANERDILHIPSYLAGSIETTEDTILLDYNCEGFLFRALEEIKALKVQSPEKLQDSDLVKALLRKHDCHIWFEKL